MRSGDMTMPEEHTRIEVDSIADLLLCPDERSRGILESEGVPGRIAVVGDVMADACFTFAPIARERSDVLDRLGLQPGTYVVATIHRDANVVEPRLGRIVAGLAAIDEPVVFPAHPRTRDALLSQGLSLGHVRLVEPLSYLDFAALASQARVIVTDSGGLQKEAYWYGIPCVTARPSTEWVDTVEQGANTLVDDDPERLVAAVAAARAAGAGPPRVVRRRQGSAEDRRSSLYPFRPMTEPRLEAQPAEPATRHWDVAVVGAGYVGVPLARLLAQSGQDRAARRRGRARRRRHQPRREPHRGRSVRRAPPARRRGPHRSDERLRRPPRRRCDRRRPAHAALEAARARHHDPRRRRHRHRRAPATGPSRRARVDDVSGHDTRGRAADPRGERPRGRPRLPSRVLAGARRSRQHALAPGERAEDRRRDHRRLHGARGRALPGRDRPGAPRLVAGGRRADEAAREHLPLGQHRARQRARPALRPDGHRRLGGRRRGVDEAVRLHALRARPRARRTLHPGRSLLPDVEGAGVRLLHRVHRAGREGQREHAVLLPLAHLAGAEPRAPAVAEGVEDPRARRRVQARHLRHARVARAEGHRAACATPGRTWPTTTRTSPACPSSGWSRSQLDPAAYDCVASSPTTRASTTTDVVDGRPARRRLPQRHGRDRAGARTRSGSFEPHASGRGRPRLLGPQPRAKLRHPRRPRVDLRLRRQRRRAHARPFSAGTDDDRLRRAARGRVARRGGRGDARAHARRARAAGRSRPASTCSSRSRRR